MAKELEIGPIRPPSEAGSLLLRVTRNCSWNKCKFCVAYENQSFSTRPIEEIKAEIDQLALYRNDILSWKLDDHNMAMEKLHDLPEGTMQGYLYVLHWMSQGEESVFLQDADTVVLSFDKLREILFYLRKKLPQVKRVTSYGRVGSLMKFSVEQLTELKEAGLDRIHSGYESGSDEVLKLINKGFTKAQEIEAGQKVKASGIELSVYFMPGVGGRDLSDDNAIETADVVNKTNPDFVRIRTFVSLQGTGLFDEINAGRIKECTDKGKMLELKKMIENIDGADGHLYCDHIINHFEDLNGNMKTDKEKMLSVFAAFERLDAQGQRRYQVARRMGMVRSLSHFELLDTEQQENVDMYLSQLDTGEKFEALLLKLLRRYITKPYR